MGRRTLAQLAMPLAYAWRIAGQQHSPASGLQQFAMLLAYEYRTADQLHSPASGL